MKKNRYGKARSLTTEQLDQLIEYLPSNFHKTIALVCRNTACRISEACGLTWECIEEEKILFPAWLVKGKLKTRDHPINQKLYKNLCAWRCEWETIKGRKPSPKDYVFYGRFEGKPITTRSFMYALEKALKRAKFGGCSSHTFRRSALSAASSKGIPLRHIMENSGHKSLQVLQRYLDVKEEDQKKAAEAYA